MAIKVFFHICCINNALTIVRDMVRSIHFSGLYDDAESIYCYIAGEEGIIRDMTSFLENSGQKFMVMKIAPYDSSYERLTLEDIHNHVTAEDKILYIHSKGVSKHSVDNIQQAENVSDWCYLMMYYLVRHYRICLEKLENYDTVGVNYNPLPDKCHWSGNFWWVRGDYFLTLPIKIGPEYHAPELSFLFVNNPRFHEMHASTGYNLYHQRYPPLKYVDTKIV